MVRALIDCVGSDSTRTRTQNGDRLQADGSDRVPVVGELLDHTHTGSTSIESEAADHTSDASQVGVPPSGVPFEMDWSDRDVPESLGRGPAEASSSHAAIADLRSRVIDHLLNQGFEIEGDRIVHLNANDKESVRALHAVAVASNRDRARSALAREAQFIGRLASGGGIDPERIRPKLVPLSHARSRDVLTWRWCALHWSIPVSSGYGRRMRFLVVDEGHDDSVIGIIGLADPVFGLACRDSAIGWDRDQRGRRLACVMDAFVLGAVPPYTDLCGGKLVALLATSTEVRDTFSSRYGHRTTLIGQRDPDAHLALVTTTSALGRSSIYNRLRHQDGQLAYRAVGYTSGSGDFHFTGNIYKELSAFAAGVTEGSHGDDALVDGRRYQRHPSWPRGTFRNRREVIQRALDGLGFNSRRLRLHGIRRQVFLAPLAANSVAWLRGEESQLRWWTASTADIGTWWRKRWAAPRAERLSEWRRFDPASWALYGDGAER